jgi:hypothetical protein
MSVNKYLFIKSFDMLTLYHTDAHHQNLHCTPHPLHPIPNLPIFPAALRGQQHISKRLQQTDLQLTFEQMQSIISVEKVIYREVYRTYTIFPLTVTFYYLSNKQIAKPINEFKSKSQGEASESSTPSSGKNGNSPVPSKAMEQVYCITCRCRHH